MANKRNRRSRKIESQSSDRDQNTSETCLTEGNATLVDVSENVDIIFDRDLGSELTEPSQIIYEIKAISQRLTEKKTPKCRKWKNDRIGIFNTYMRNLEQIKTIS